MVYKIIEKQDKDIKDFYDVVVGGLRTVGQIKIIDRAGCSLAFFQKNL